MSLHLTDEEMKDIAKKVSETVLKSFYEKKEFAKNGQDEVMERIYTYFKDNEEIDNTSISYNKEDYPFTVKEFEHSFDNLMNYALDVGKSATDPNNSFPHYHFFLKYKDIQILMRIMFGQGTSMQMWLSTEDWSEEQSFTYEEFKQSLQTKK